MKTLSTLFAASVVKIMAGQIHVPDTVWSEVGNGRAVERNERGKQMKNETGLLSRSASRETGIRWMKIINEEKGSALWIV
jgi:hypothetical protein